MELGYNEIEALDFLFDMNIPGLCDILTDQVKSYSPGVAVVKSNTYKITALMYFRPPMGIRMFEDQVYQIFVAHDLDMLFKYFREWSDHNTDIYLNPILSRLCNILQSNCGKTLKTKFTTEAI